MPKSVLRVMALRELLDAGTQAGVLEHAELKDACLVRQRQLQHGFIRAVATQHVRIARNRLDMDAAPAVVIKRPAHRVDQGILGAHVDVPSGRHMLERAPQHDVFEILRIGNERHGIVRGVQEREPAWQLRCSRGNMHEFGRIFHILRACCVRSWA
jgi:hypothetical protein